MLTNLHIERYGDGRELYFGLHGWSGNHQTFAPIVAGMPDACTFYSVDLPGCGTSGPPVEWKMAAVAREIADFIGSLYAPVTLVGNCSGANIGCFVAKLIPDRIARLVTIDAFAYWPWYFSVFVNRFVGRYAYFTTFENPIGRWLTNLSLTSKRREDTSLTDGFTRVDHRATYRYLTMLHEAGGVDQFAGFKMPIEITFGARSFAGVRESAAIFQGLWPQAGVTCLEGAGHLPILEATDLLQQIIFRDAGHQGVYTQTTRETPCPRHSNTCAS